MAELDTGKVFSVFALFYNEDDAESFLPVAELAAEHIGERILGEEADQRLYYLAAAETLCRVMEIKAAREHLSLTRTGAVSADSSDYERRAKYAEKLYNGYEAMCAGIVRDDGFLFLRME